LRLTENCPNPMQPGETKQEKVYRLRTLNEGEKLSLIFTQQRKLNEYQERIESLQCAHSTGVCALCCDKDLTIVQLQNQIEQLKNKLYGRSSERQGKGQKGKARDGQGGNPRAKGSTQRTRLPSEQFPDARIRECIVEENPPPQCSDCALAMTDSGMKETAERIEYQPAEIYIQRTHRVRYHCKCCRSAPQTAVLPERLAPGTSLGDSLILQACISKFYDLIPTTRFAKILARGRTALSHRLLLKAQSVMAFVLGSVYRAIQQEVAQSRVIFADETIHRQLEENNGHWRWYLWGFSNKTSIYFEIRDTRAGEVSIQFLKLSEFVIFLVSDAYSGYTRTLREINEERSTKGLPLLQSCLCNDHGRRYFFYARQVELAQKALDVYDKIYEIEREVQELLRNPVYLEPENSVQALRLRQTADPLFNQIYDISGEILLEAPEKSLEATAARYFLNHVSGLTLYLRHIELPISNARSERGIRDSVLLRKTALGNHSKAGAEEAAIQLTVMGSCKVAQVNPQEYLDFMRLRYLAKKPPLTPYQYKLHRESRLQTEVLPDTS
jgi:transposase